MRFAFLALLCAAFCGLSAQQNINHTLIHQGQNREFIVHLPVAYAGGSDYPVVFVLHGGGLGSGSQQQSHTKMDVVADTAGFIAVYPTALNANWADGRSNPSDDAGVDDIGFFVKMIDFLKSTYSVDAERVFSCGMSNGAFMSHRIAIELSDRIAAVACVAGTMGPDLAAKFPPINQMPVLIMHGTNDRYVPYDGGAVVVTRGEAIPVETAVDMYSGYNACDLTPVKTNLPNTNKLDLSTVELYTYVNCDNQADVLFYKIVGGGHTWPGATKIAAFGSTNQDINASGEIWRFFSRKRRVGAPQLTAIEIKLSLTPNPASHELQFESTGEEMPKVVDQLGRTYKYQLLSKKGNRMKIDVSELSPGEYFFKLGNRTERFWIR